MELKTVSDLGTSGKANMRLLVVGKAEYPYGPEGSEMIRTVIHATDSNNAEIEMVGFDDVKPMCRQMQNSETYVFNDLLVAEYRGKRQLKLTAASTIHKSSVQISPKKATLSSLAEKQVDDRVSFECVVAHVGDMGQSSVSGSRMREYMFADPTTTCVAVGFNDGADEAREVGSIVRIKGKIGNRSNVVFFSPPEEVENEELLDWWTKNKSNIVEEGERAAKRTRVEAKDKNLAEIKMENIGERINFDCVVVSVQLPTFTQNKTEKRVLDVCDKSGLVFELVLFGSSEGIERDINIGDVLHVDNVQVSDWSRISLTGNFSNISFLSSDHPLMTWWSGDSQKPVFVRVSDNSMPVIYTSKEVEQDDPCGNNFKTYALNGFLENGTFRDSEGSLPIGPHASFQSRWPRDGPIKLRNVIFRDGKLIVFKNSIRTDTEPQTTPNKADMPALFGLSNDA